MILKENRIKSPKHRAYIASLPCMIERRASQYVVGHHLLRAHPIKGIGLKSCDIWTVPLDARLHNDLHSMGNEIEFFDWHGWNYERVKMYALKLALKSPSDNIKRRAEEHFEIYFKG